ncbi:MAG: hypothetical protein JSW58_05095 [Candidatus Latescibacterota bacterium]|nr:MAG: hypothetical protein JSW58_05095 [Candidatus Latescibacterota bacterium]
MIIALVTGFGAVYAAIRAVYYGGLWVRRAGDFWVSAEQAIGVALLLFIMSIWSFWKAIPRERAKQEPGDNEKSTDV